MEGSSSVAARVRPLPPKNTAWSAKLRPVTAVDPVVAAGNQVPRPDEHGQPLLPNQAFEAAILWRVAHAAPKPRECAQPGCTKQRVSGAQAGMQRVFCYLPLPSDRHHMRPRSPPTSVCPAPDSLLLAPTMPCHGRRRYHG